MKIKDLQDFPEKKELWRYQEHHHDELTGYNQALSELGELEIGLDVDKIKQCFDIEKEIDDAIWTESEWYFIHFGKKRIENRIATAIATAIEQGEIVKLKENDNG